MANKFQFQKYQDRKRFGILRIRVWNLMVYCFLNIVFIFLTENTFCQNPADSTGIIKKVNDSILIINKKITINTNSRTISFSAKFNKVYGRNGFIELVLCTKIGKAYESLMTTEVTPIELQTALLLLGYRSLENKLPFNEKDMKKREKKIKKVDSLYLYVQWDDSNKVNTHRIENFIWNSKDSAYLKPVSWFFNGLLTNENGTIKSSEWTSMIVTNYDFASILSMNFGTRFNTESGQYLKNVAGDIDFYSKVDERLLGKDVRLIIKPAGAKKTFFKRLKLF